MTPFFDRLRFYPVPHATASRLSGDVSVETAGEVRARLARRKAQLDVLRMNEAILIWAPLYDRTVALFLETLDGDLPRLAPSASGAQVVEGGWPCRRSPADFSSRAHAILDDYAKLRNHHRLCTKPEKPKENFARLRRLLDAAAPDPTKLELRDVPGAFYSTGPARGQAGCPTTSRPSLGLDGVYVRDAQGTLEFHELPTPSGLSHPVRQAKPG